MILFRVATGFDLKRDLGDQRFFKIMAFEGNGEREYKVSLLSVVTQRSSSCVGRSVA